MDVFRAVGFSASSMPGRRARRRGVGRVALVGAVAVACVVAATGTGQAESLTPIPGGGATVLPEFIGEAAAPRPLPPAAVPQSPSLAPNPFNNVHSDTWMSDTADIAGPLGRVPQVLSSTLSEARRSTNSPAFICGSIMFDSHGRLVGSCVGPGEASLVLLDPVTLEVLSYFWLPTTTNESVGLASAYVYLDNRDRVVVGAVDGTIKVVETGSAQKPSFKQVGEYHLARYLEEGDNLAGVMPDWHGQIWFATRVSASIGVLDPATDPAAAAVPTIRLGSNEQIKNTFAVDDDSVYVVTTRALYSVTAGPDGRPKVVWSAPYENIGTTKPGQYSPGSGTTPTILGHGQYVAIADNADQTHVVVYRTAARLAPHQQRTVCQVPVFKPGRGAVEDSLIGSGRSLIVENNYGYVVDLKTLKSTPTEPGIARVDIDSHGKGCGLVWENDTATAPNVALKLSTRTGLVYTITRKYDTKVSAQPPGLDVYYWAAIDFRTGKVVWERQAGTGSLYDGYYPGLAIGPTGTAYVGQYGGMIAIRDTR